jgi:VWFA-related protein
VGYRLKKAREPHGFIYRRIQVKKYLLTGISLVFFPILAHAQQPAATPPKDDEVVKISTDLIQIDVTVTDKNGRVVTGLKPEDFSVFENGDKQEISNFAFASRSAAGATLDSKAGIAGRPGDTAPAASATSVRRTVVIMVDDLNMSAVSIYYVRHALNTFVDKQMQDNDLVAIIRTSGNIGALQQFTSNKQLLHAAIDRIRWYSLGTGRLDSLASVSQNDRDVTERFNSEVAVVTGRPVFIERQHVSDKKYSESDLVKASTELEEGVYAQATLGALRYVIGGMNDLPGRKMMMLFSDGIRIESDSSKSRADAVLSMLEELADFANRSSIVIYTYDTKGMKPMQIDASDNTYEVIDGHRETKLAERFRNFKATQEGLAYIANQTGGKALMDSDDFNGGIQRALEEQSGYYLLGYVPDADTFDASKRRYNKLEVKVNRPGLNVSYRSGFFGTSSPTASASAATVNLKMAAALASPFASNEIALNMNALYADDAADGAYIRTFLHIDANNLTFTDDAGGWKKAKFDVAAVTFGDNGVPVDKKESEYTIKTKGPTYDAMLKNGFVYVLTMPVKTTGLVQFRAAVRDSSSGKIGSASQVVDIPNLAKKKLTLSSLAVENVSMATWQLISQGKVGNGPGQTQIASTLLYDTVLKQFQAGTVLRYGYEVYNASPDGKAPDLVTQARIMQNDKVVIEGTAAKFSPAGQTDFRHIKIPGQILLKDTLAPGNYVLQVIVTDSQSKRVATQQFPFEVIK